MPREDLAAGSDKGDAILQVSATWDDGPCDTLIASSMRRIAIGWLVCGASSSLDRTALPGDAVGPGVARLSDVAVGGEHASAACATRIDTLYSAARLGEGREVVRLRSPTLILSRRMRASLTYWGN